jgi:hypothetical protein
MIASRCLIPISVDSREFRTANFLPALKSLPKAYETYLFFVADGLQLYNRASRVLSGEHPLPVIMREFNTSRSSYVVEKERWLSRLRKRLHEFPVSQTGNWEVVGIGHVEDMHLVRIWRNVLLLAACDLEFRQDVRETARLHAEKAKTETAESRRIDLSVLYVLEEIALSIRLRVLDQIQDEYYLGFIPPPMLKVYMNEYQANVFQLADVDEYELKFNFFRFDRELGWIDQYSLV